MAEPDFLYRDLPVVNKRVHRLGLSFSFGIDGAGVEAALDAGMNYLFWNKMFGKGETHEVIEDALSRDRERYILASGARMGFSVGGVRRGAEHLLETFGVDYVDVYHLFWLGRMSAFTDAIQQELVKLREEGLVRAIGISIHDRERAGRLVTESPLDLFMIRYNAAHPGAEKDIFPAYAERRPLTVAYTATSWRKLLSAPKGWDGPAMTAGQCYRFCLSSPHVDVVLCGPKTDEQLRENLAALEDGPLTSEEDEWMRRFGRAVHG
jgi:aryl-alcohol dehydrogenase-like predicted oxidoreductase